MTKKAPKVKTTFSVAPEVLEEAKINANNINRPLSNYIETALIQYNKSNKTNEA